MNRNLLLGWALLMSLFLMWTQYKTHQAKESQKQVQLFKADSLAQYQKTHPEVKGRASETSLGETATASDSTHAAARIDSGSVPRHRIRVETPHFTAVLDNQGARISELTIPDLEGKPVFNHTLIRPESEGALTLTLNNHDLGTVVWKTDARDTVIKLGSEPITISFTTTLAGVGEVVRKYTFQTDKPVIRHETTLPDNNVSSYALEWKGGLEETEKLAEGRGFGLLSGFFSEVVYDNGVSVQRTAFTGEKTFNGESGVVRWLGMRRKYVAVLLDFHKEIQDKIQAVGSVNPDQPSAPHHYSLRVAGNAEDGNALDFDVVVLPLQYSTIKAMDRNYEQILFSGWEWFLRADLWYVKLCGFVLRLLNLFYHWIPNYGIAIILLTLLVRIITLPLSISQTRQGAKMAQHQPEIKKIQEKYKGDRQKMQMETMAYYRQQGINPLAPVMGCLPAMLQMPVFISLFNVLGRAVELRGTPFFGWIHDLSIPDVILPAFKLPFFFPMGLTILPFFMAGTMWVQMRMTLKDPNQKAMIWLMPIMMFVFSGSFPSGLVLYWTVSNLFTMAQTKVFTPKPSKSPVIGRAKPAKA